MQVFNTVLNEGVLLSGDISLSYKKTRVTRPLNKELQSPVQCVPGIGPGQEFWSLCPLMRARQPQQALDLLIPVPSATADSLPAFDPAQQHLSYSMNFRGNCSSSLTTQGTR